MTATVLATRPARGSAVLDGAGSSSVITYTSSVDGAPLTGLVHLPASQPTARGWPVVTYGHMTTGGGDRSAPSRADAGNPELRRMTQGDALCARLVRAGVAVLRPDYPGLGSPGVHPYLIGTSLGRSVLDLLAAARRHDDRLAPDWVSAGHSEGALAAAFAVSGGVEEGTVPEGVVLRGIALASPITRLDVSIGCVLRSPLALPGTTTTSLIALMFAGAATADPRLADLLESGGLSERAVQLWPQLQQRTLNELTVADSFGGLAPSALLGPRGPQARRRLLDSLRANETGALAMPAGVPVRVDFPLFDEVAPSVFTELLVRRWRRAGVRLEAHRWWDSHSTLLRSHRAPGPIARWIVDRLA